MSHPEDDPSLLHSSLHLQAIIQVGRHRLLAQNVVPLLSKRKTNFEMHLVLHGNNDSITEPLADCLDGLCGRLVQLLPGIEDEGLVYVMCGGEVVASLRARFRHGDDLALGGLLDCISSVRLVRWTRLEFCVLLSERRAYLASLAASNDGDGQRVGGVGEENVFTHDYGGGKRRRRGAWAESLPEAFRVMISERHN